VFGGQVILFAVCSHFFTENNVCECVKAHLQNVLKVCRRRSLMNEPVPNGGC